MKKYQKNRPINRPDIQLRTTVIPSRCAHRRGNPHLKEEIATPVCGLVRNDTVALPINRPVLWVYPWWQTDLQALPPWGWCPHCGAELYVPATACSRCRKENRK